MKRLIAVLLALATVGFAAACEPAISPPPVPPPVSYLFKQIFYSSYFNPNVPAPENEPHSCAILVEPADSSLHAPYSTVDTAWNANGWAFWTACVIPARDSGRALPVVKITGDPNEQTTLVLAFHLDSAPVFGRGSGHYDSFNATNIAVWRKTYIEATG